MKHRISVTLLMGFGTLIASIVVLGFSASRRADRIESDINAISSQSLHPPTGTALKVVLPSETSP